MQQQTSQRTISTIKRYLLFFIGMWILAFGIAFSIIADLGTSTISAPPYVVSLFTRFTVGQMTMTLHTILILLQIAILRRQYQPIQLLQFPVALIFGLMCDAALWCVGDIVVNTYAMQWLYCIIGVVLVAIGVSCEVVANVLVLAGEGFVLAVCQGFKTDFSKTKIGFDVVCVIIAVVLSYFFLDGRIEGVREGTLFSALFVGVLVKPLTTIIGRINLH